MHNVLCLKDCGKVLFVYILCVKNIKDDPWLFLLSPYLGPYPFSRAAVTGKRLHATQREERGRERKNIEHHRPQKWGGGRRGNWTQMIRRAVARTYLINHSTYLTLCYNKWNGFIMTTYLCFHYAVNIHIL
jgi:hypothetical protein